MDISDIFTTTIQDNKEYQEAVAIIRRNSHGRIWLIGGFIYRTLANTLYGIPMKSDLDLDFVLERPSDSLILPPEWEIRKNIFGNKKLLKGNIRIDYIPLFSIGQTIEDALKIAPLTIQSIAYNLDTLRIIGEIGIKAILERTARINNPEQTRRYLQMKGLSLEDYVKDKVRSLGFNFES